MDTYKREEIYYVDGDDEKDVGSVQHGNRPAIIISNDKGNSVSPVLEIVWLTTKHKKPLPTHVSISSAIYPSTALCEQIVTIDKSMVRDYAGMLTKREMESVDRALMISIGLSADIVGSSDGSDDIEESDQPVSDSQIMIAKLEAERDVYKNLYERMVGIT